MGALDTTNEGDNAHLRYQGQGSRHVNVRVEEDTTHPSCECPRRRRYYPWQRDQPCCGSSQL